MDDNDIKKKIANEVTCEEKNHKYDRNISFSVFGSINDPTIYRCGCNYEMADYQFYPLHVTTDQVVLFFSQE